MPATAEAPAATGSLPRLTPVDFPTLGPQLIDWIETFLRHGPGPVIGERWIDSDDPELPGLGIDREEGLHLAWCYRLNPETGRRVFRRVVRVRPKGRRKSELAGVLCLIEALGPCRFDHWAEEGEVSWWGYPYEEGEPVGRPNLNPRVDCYATEEGQAGNTYDNVYEMAGGRDLLEGYPGLSRGLGQTDLPNGGVIAPNTSGDASQEGGIQVFGVFDETYLWHSNRLRNQHRVVTRNLKKTAKLTDAWQYETSNAHFVGQNSILESAYGRALKLGSLDAMVKAGILVDWLEPTDKLVGKRAFQSDRRVKRALRELYGPAAEWMDLDIILGDIRDPEAREEDSRRAWLNLASSNGSAWLDIRRVEALVYDATVHRRTHGTIRPGTAIVAGFDGSRWSDSTALIIQNEKGLMVPWRVWEKLATDGDDWGVDDDEVNAAVDELFETFAVARMYADPFLWDTNIARWHRRNGKAVREWRTNRDREMALATNDFEVAVRSAGMRFDTSGPYGDTLLRHFANTHVRQVTAIIDPRTRRLGHIPTKERKGSPLKIDCSPASILCQQARVDAIANNEFRMAKRLRRRGAGIGLHPLSK